MRAVPREVVLTLRNDMPYTNLQLQLSIARDCEWISKCWKACSAGNELAVGDFGDAEFRPLQLREDSGSETGEPEGPFAAASPSLKHAVSMLPTEAPKDGSKDPVYVQTVPTLSMSVVRDLFDKDDWIMDRFLCESLGAFDVRWEPFMEPPRTPGVKVRRCRYMMPLPQDVPRAVASIIGMPKESNITTVFHMRITEDEVLLVHQTITHDVMYGDKFRAQDTHSFRPGSGGGVTYTKWSEVVWLAALPWTHGMVKNAVESKTVETAKAKGPDFVRLFCNAPAA